MVIFFLILLVTTLLFQNPLSVKGETSEKRFTITTTVTYSNNGTTDWDLTGEDYAISLFMNNSWQSVSLVEHSLPLNSNATDGDGNLLGFLNLTQLSYNQSVSYAVKYEVVSKPRLLPNITEEQSLTLADINDTLKDEYCWKEGPWLQYSDDQDLRDLAYRESSNETRVLSIVKNFVRWITDYVVYDSAEIPRYPNETYIERKGDCDDKAILLITLCRIVGIPAYLQVGCIYDFFSLYSKETYWQGHVTSVLKQIGWHGWAIVYVPPWGWLPVDLTYVPIDPYLSNSLNAIKGAAVTGQDVIQYMNFTHTDYVGASRRLRDFIQSNDFYIYMIDEMKTNIDFGSALEIVKLIFRGALIATAVIAILLATVLVYKSKRTTKLEP
jgi:transglutaminase-like putative cysteine protease